MASGLKPGGGCSLRSLVLFALVALPFGSVGLASAQVPSMTITFPAPSQVGFSLFPPGTTAADIFGASIAIFADGVFCIEGDVASPSGIVVGGVSQPTPCRTSGAQVTFVGAGRMAWDYQIIFEPGGTRPFAGYGLIPAGAAYPDYVCQYVFARGWTPSPELSCRNSVPTATPTSSPTNTPTPVATATATPTQPGGGWIGELPKRGSPALLVTASERPATQLLSQLRSDGCDAAAIAVIRNGVWLVYIPGAPGAVNAAFPPILGAQTPFFLRC